MGSGGRAELSADSRICFAARNPPSPALRATAGRPEPRSVLRISGRMAPRHVDPRRTPRRRLVVQDDAHERDRAGRPAADHRRDAARRAERQPVRHDAGRRHGLEPRRGRRAISSSSSARRAACATTDGRRSRSAITPGTGRSACWCAPRPRRCATRASSRSPRTAAIRAMAARRARPGMFDSLPYRNDAAITMRRLIRSLPRRSGVMGIATCDKGLPAMMLALAGCARPARRSSCPAASRCRRRRRGCRQGAVDRRAVRARPDHARGGRRHGLPRVRHAGRRLPVPGDRRDVAGGRRGVRPDAAAQRAGAVGRAGLARHGAPLGARAGAAGRGQDAAVGDPDAGRARERDAACTPRVGGSTNLLLHIPALAHAAGLARPTRRRLDARQPRDAAAGRRAAERSAQPPDRAGLSWPAACPR